jgi:hypothetical protein
MTEEGCSSTWHPAGSNPVPGTQLAQILEVRVRLPRQAQYPYLRNLPGPDLERGPREACGREEAFEGEGADPRLRDKAARQQEDAVAPEIFGAVALEWFEKKKPGKKESYTNKIIGRLNKDLFPFLQDRPIADIKAPELLEALRKVESRGAVVTAHRCLLYSGQIFRYAVSTGRAPHDIPADLKGALSTAVHTRFSSLTEPKKIGELLRAIDA